MTDSTTDKDKGLQSTPMDADDELLAGAPSRLAETEPVFARNVGLVGVLCVLFGLSLWGYELYKQTAVFKYPVLIRLWVGMGTFFMLFHAARDKSIAVRRSYGALAFALLVFGATLTGLASVKAWSGNEMAGEITAAVLGLIMVAATSAPFVRDEVKTEGGNPLSRWWQGMATSSQVQKVSVAGVLVVVAALIVGHAVRQLEPGLLLSLGVTGLTLGLMFVLPYATHESVASWRDAGVYTVGAVGCLAVLTAFCSTFTDLVGLPSIVLPHGLLLGLMGLAFLGAFIGQIGSESEIGHRAAVALGVIGLAMILVALIRSGTQTYYMVPAGFLLMCLGAVYALLGWGFVTDIQLMVLFRRELTAYFYSPIAYVVVAGMAVVAWGSMFWFVNRLGLTALDSMGQPIPEPIVQFYFVDIFLVLTLVFFVPAVTMRLLSEEQRTGTMEVLLTAPVGEFSLVFSKFLAAWCFFMICWLPWAFFPVIFRVIGEESFDFRPLLSFFLGMGFMSAGFVSMGLFCSSLSRNQIIAALLCFAGMGLLTLPYFLQGRRETDWDQFLKYSAYLDHLIQFGRGKVYLKHLIFHASMTGFWLFLTVKVVESRKWR
jgi:ABC-2 type transport system permease protein